MTTDPLDNAFPFFGDPNLRERGLTKREYFAALAMQGLLASEESDSFPHPEYLSLVAVRTADALIAVLNGEGQANG